MTFFVVSPRYPTMAIHPEFRMYVDEVGNPDLAASRSNENHRYLSLTGVVCSLTSVTTTIHPALEDLKRKYFGAHPDEPIILHRKELVNQRPPFAALRDPNEQKQAFDQELLDLLRDLEYVVITAVIDKRAHLDKYNSWSHDPYHYCLAVIFERYVLWLSGRGARGDVMAESRGGREDQRLKNEYARIFLSGTTWVSHKQIVAAVTSSQLKVKPKSANVAGLQLADLIAHPSYAGMLAERGGKAVAPFGAEVFAILTESKYRRSGFGTTDGYGRKWLP